MRDVAWNDQGTLNLPPNARWMVRRASPAHRYAIVREAGVDMLLDSLEGGPIWLLNRAEVFLERVRLQGGNILEVIDNRGKRRRRRPTTPQKAAEHGRWPARGKIRQ